MLLVDTIVPWSSEWLFHYEMWKGTGIWFGDGPDAEHPEAQAKMLHPLPAHEAREAPDFNWPSQIALNLIGNRDRTVLTARSAQGS